MGNRFLDSGNGAPSTPFETEADAATTLQAIITDGTNPLLAGEDIFVAADHSEDPGANITYTFPGTESAPNRVISATLSGPTYNKADNIQIDNSGGLRDINIDNYVKFYGISFKVGDDLRVNFPSQSVLFDDSILELSSSNGSFSIGDPVGQNIIELKNTDLNFSGGGALAGIKISSTGIFKWDGGTISWTGTQPTALFDEATRTQFISVAGVDLSAITTALVDVSDTVDRIAEFHHCKLAAGVALTTGTINSVGTKILMSGCDDTTGNDLYRFEYVDYYGSIVHDDAIFVTTGGTSDGTTPISWKMVTTANAKEFSEPLISPPIVVWVDATGSTTFTVQCLWDSVTNIQNDEIWLEVEFLEASADTDSAFANDGLADILATPADQTTNATAWTESLTNDNEFAIAVTATVNRVGPAICRVHMGKPSTTVYVDPKVTVT